MPPNNSIKAKKTKQSAVVSFNPSNNTFVCVICKDKLHDQIPEEWGIWEIPRHLEKEHGLPKEAYALRVKLIPDWNSEFEKQYRNNLNKELIYHFENQNKQINEVDVDNLSKKFKRQDEKDMQLDLEADRESD